MAPKKRGPPGGGGGRQQRQKTQNTDDPKGCGGGAGGGAPDGTPRGDSALPGAPKVLEYHLGNDESAGVGEFKSAEMKAVDKNCPIHLELRWPFGHDGTSRNFEKVVEMLLEDGSGLERVSRLQVSGFIGEEGGSGMQALTKLISSANMMGTLHLSMLTKLTAPILDAVPAGVQAVTVQMLDLDENTQHALVELASRCASTLEKLDISFCGLQDELFAKIVDSLSNARAPVLHEFCAMSAELSDHGPVVKLLQGSVPIRKLQLAGNQFNASSAKAIAAALKECSTIEHVDLSSNKLGMTGTDAIIAAAKENNSITSVQLHKTGLNKAQKDKLTAQLPDSPKIDIM